MINVLVADDHPFLRAGIESVLRTAGMSIVASVGDGNAALEAIADHDPDVVVLDVAMPERDGVSTLARCEPGETRGRWFYSPQISTTSSCSRRSVTGRMASR